jgi:hypothetical protein
MTWPSTRCTWSIWAETSTTVTFGKSRASALSKPGTLSGARKAVITVAGKSGKRATGNMTKKLTRIEPQSTLRRLVILASCSWPAMSKPSRSPSLRPSVAASPSSTLAAPVSSAFQAPRVTWLWPGSVSLWLRLNSRSTRRLARASPNRSGPTGWLLMATRRPRIIGYQS